MNKIFKVIWSKSKQCYIVVSEIAKNKTGKKKIVVASILATLALTSNVVTVHGAMPDGSRTDTLGVAIGIGSASNSNQSVAIGYASSAQAPSSSPENPATAVGAGANANGTGAVAFGLSANATGANAVALGGGSNGGKNKTEATADYATAIGFNAKATASNSIAMGKSASITKPDVGTLGGQDSIAMGTGASAKQHSSISVGLGAASDGVRSVAIGPKASATDEDSIAIGTGGVGADKNNQATGNNGGSATLTLNGISGVQLYYGAKSTGKQSIAIGYIANANDSGIAIGNYAVSDSGGGTAMGKSVISRSGGIVVGQSSNAIGTNSVAYGNTVYATDANSVALGNRSTASNKNAVVVGYNSNATGEDSVAIGNGNQASNKGAVSVGASNSVTANNAVAIGRSSNASGLLSTAIGNGAISKGIYDVAIGSEVTADGNNSVAIGRSAKTSNTSSLAIGVYGTKGTSATGDYSIAMGRDVTASAESAIAIGKDAVADKKNAVAFGSGSDTSSAATAQSSTTIGGKTYSWNKGVLSGADLAGMQVSVGKTGFERQIKNVAAGEISANSTDAINGAQLYSVASGLAKDLKVPYVSIKSGATGSGSNVDNDGATGPNSIAIGPSSAAKNQDGVAFGNNAQSLSDYSIAIGTNAKAESGSGLTNASRAIAIGANSRVATNVTQGIAIGSGSVADEGAVVTGDQSIAIGGNVKVDGHAAVAIGGDDARKAAAQTVSYTSTNDVEVTGSLQTAIQNLTGYNLSKYQGTAAGHAGVAYGTSALAGNAGVAIGTASDSMTRKDDKGNTISNKPVTNAVAIGTGARANFDNSVAIGGGSNTDHYATKQVNAIIDGVEVKWSGGENISPGDVVSFGAKGFERQLKNVAPGEVSQTSTDAVNGSQIYSLARKVTNIMNGGSGSVVNVNATGEPLSKVSTIENGTKVEKYYRTADVKDDGTLVTGAVAQTPASLALVNVAQTDTNKQTQTPRILGNVANGVKDNDAVNVSQLNAAKVKYFSVKSSDAGNVNNDGATGTDAIAIGPSATSNDVGSVALGKDAKANGAFTVALGGGNWQFKGAQANGVGTTALGSNTKTKANTNFQTAIGFGASTDADSALALGYNASAAAQNAIALGKSASTAGQDSLALGVNSQANGGSALAMGPGAQANSNYVVSLGYQANNGATNNANGVSIGWAAGMQSNGSSNVGIGSGAGRQISGNNNVSIGNGAGNIASSNLYTSDSIMLGTEARAINGTASKAVSSVIAIGKKASGGADSAIALGQGASSTNQNSIAIGTNSQATAYNGVAIGAYSVANTAGGVAGFNPNTSRTDTYSGLTGGALTSTTGAVAIGSDSQSRQLTGLAAGTQDTDAVNVAQLKSVNLAFKGNAGTGDVNLAAHPLTIQGNDNYITTSANGNTINIFGKVQNITVTNGTATAANKGMADAQNVADAINNAVQSNAYKWKLTANGEATSETIAKDDTVDFSGDTNISVARNGKKITTSLKKDITVDSVKANKSITTGAGSNQITLDGTSGAVTGRTFSGNSFAAGDNVLSNTTLQIGPSTGGNNVSITRDGLTAKAGTKTVKFGTSGIDAGNQQITGVSSGGNVGTNAANITDVQNAVSSVSLNLDTNSKTGSVNLKSDTLKITGANGIRTDLIGTGNRNLVIGLDQNTVNATTKGIGLSGDSGTMLRKFLKDGNADFKISGDGGLVTTSGTTTGVQVSVDKAKVKDLAVEAVTVSKANTVDNPITVTSTASTNSKEYAIGIDTTKLAAKTNLAYTANGGTAKTVSLAKGLNFVNGANTVATVDSDGKVSFDLNTTTKNQINTNTTDIAANKGKIATNTTNIATNTANIAHTIALADDKGTSTTAKSLKDGNVSFNIKGDNKFISTAASGNDVTLTVNEQAIKDAAKSASSFKVKANAHAEEEVKGGDTITFNNGDNIEIGQTGKTFTIKTAKNMTVDSLTAGNTVINTTGLTSGTGASAVSFGTNGISAGNQVISNVASGGTTDTNAANIGDVKQAVANLSQNLNITDGTNNGTVDLKNQKLNVAGANGVTANVKNQTITVGLDADTVNATTKGIGLTGDTGSTGNKYLKDGDVSFAVTGDGNLVSTSATAAGMKVAVDAAKVKDLAVAAVTVSKDTQADNPITVTPTAGANSKDYAIGIDTTKLAAKTDLTYRANSAADANAKKVSLSKGLDFVDGDSTVATVDNDGKVSFDLNTATKNQINTNTTDITANKGKIATNTTNIAANTTALARNISLGADTGTASSQSLSTADVAFNVKGATGDFISTNMNGNTVEISTTRATINSNATTGEASVTGNDGLATAKNVADAINKAADAAKAGAAWNITTNSSTTDKTAVKGGDTVDLVNGDNIEITQDGTDKKKITVATKKDITVDSVTANNKVTVGSGANKITLDGTDGSVTGKTFTGTTFTGTSFTGTSFTAGNTVINTNGLTNGTTAITGTGVTTDNVTVGGISIDKTTGINAGNNVISNVASGGTTLTNAANIGDVQNAVANLSQNLNITDGTHDGTVDLKNQKLNVAGANGVTATVNNQTITVGLDADTVNATTKGIGLTADTGSTGNKYLKDGDVSFAVTGDGSLVSTSATAAGVKVAVNSATITAGTDGTITGPTTDGVATAKNVADAINAAKKASKTEITANTGEAANATTGNVTLTSTTAADGHTIYDVKLNDKVTLGTGANAVTVDGTTGAITGKTANIGGVTVNGTANTIGGLSNTTWNGTAVSGRAATEDQLKAATGATTLKFTGDVATNTGSVNLKDDTFGIKGDGKYISTDVNGKNVNLTVSEAEVKKSAVAAVTVSTDTTDANNPLTVTPTTSADGTTKDYKVTIDGTKIANKTNLSYKANNGTAKQVSLADGLNFKNGTLTTASIDDAGVVKYDVNTASITAGTDGTITGPTTDGVATAKNVADAINAAKKASKTEITANTGEVANATTGNMTLTSTTAADGHIIYDVKLNDKVTLGTGANAVTIDGTAGKATIGSSIVDGVNNTFTTGGAKAVTLNGATGTITGTTANLGVVTVDGTAGTVTGLTNKDWTPGVTKAVSGRAATEDQLQKVADAASSQTWQITADKDTATSGAQTGTKKDAKVGKDDKVQLIAGENLTVNQNERDFTYSLNKDLVKMNSATFEATGGKTTVIKGDSIVQTDGVNVNTSNATSNTITDGTNTSTITAGKAQIGTVGIDGVVSKISTGGTNAVVVNGADGTIKTGNVTVTGGTTNDITGLSNTTLTATDFATKGRAATEEQLKAATGATTLKFTGDVATNTGSVNLKDDTFGIKGDGKYISTDVNGKNVNLTVSEAEVKKSAVAAVTVSTDTTDANNPLTVTPTTSADGTTKDYKVTIDGTKIANKTNLSYKANDGTAKQVSLADGLNFKNGTLTTASIDDNGVVKYDVNTAAITAGADGTITGPITDGVATAQNVADAINAAKKASKTEITANTGEAANATTGNVTLTSTTAADGHTIYDVKLNDKVTLGSGANAVTVDGTAAKVTAGVTTVDGATGTITTGGTNSIKVDGATGTVTGLTNKDWTPGVTKAVTGRAATEDQLQKVADAASSQTWNITADKAGTTGAQTGTKKNATVGKDETVELVAGDNLTINQDERKFTYSLNKDLAGLTSVSIGTGTTETIKLDGATGKITAKNAAIGGVTVDGDNKHVTGLSNTTWNGTATTGRAATEDQLKAVADTAKTTTDAVNLKFSGDTNTSPGVVNLKDDTLGIVGDGKYVSTDANGKNLTVKVSEAEIKKSAVAAVTVSTDTTDANNPLTVTPTTSADATTKDYKVTIDGTKIANKTNLSYKANDGTAKQVSLADGLNFKNGTLTTASIDDAGVVKYDVNTAAITAGTDGTITGPTKDGVATAKNVADAINAAKKASKTEITANTGEAANATTGNVTLTSTTAADGHTIYDVKLNDKVTLGTGANAVTVDGTTGAITGKTATIGGVTVNGTSNTISGLSNTTWNGTATTGQAATEDQLKAVADAAGSQTWEITADKKAGTSGAQTGTKENAKVGKDDKVSLIAGENLTVGQAGKNFTYSLNTDLVKMNSATFLGTGTNTTVITGDSITQTAGTQTNTSTAAGNTVANGTKSTETTADGQVIKDGTKINTSTVDENTIVDGARSNKTTVASNVIDDGNGNVNTSNATSNTITDGTNTSAITAGKGQIGSVGIDGIASKITTGGANAVVINGADGTIKTGTVTVTGGTTNDITGLSNTTVTAADFATKGRAATEEQLKAATGATTLKFTGDVATNTGSVNLKDDTFGIKGDGKYISTDVNGKNVNLTVSEAEVKKSAVAAVTVSTDTTDANNPISVTPTTSADGTTKDYKVTIDSTKIANKTNLSYKANDGTPKQVSLADGLNFKNGTLTTASIDDNGVVKYDVNTASITAGADGTITGPTADGVATAQNVADAINAAKKASKTEITANTGEAANATTGNVTLTSTTAADGHTIYDVKLNDKVTLGSGANAVTIDGTAGKATIGSSIVDGVNNTFTTGGASPVTLNGATGTITGKTANIGGVTVDGTNNHVMGLANKDWTPGVTQAVSGRAATEDQLQKVSDAVGAGWKVNTGKVTGSTGESNGAASTKVASGEEVQFQAGNNLVVDQNGKTVAYSLNKALKDLESATFNGTGTNKTVINGDSITQTAGTQTNTSTAGGNTVADGTKSTETTADGQVIKDGAKSNKSTVDSNVIDDGNGKVNTSNAISNTITDGTNTSTIIAGKATIGSSIVDGVNNTFTTGGANAVKLDGVAGTIKTGTVTVTGGTTNDITGLSNTTVTAADFATKGRAATEEQLKAVGEQTWQITADKDTATSGAQTGTKKDAKVGKDDKVQLIAGENMTVNQNERDFTFTLNKDLVKMNSATFEATGGKTTVIKGDSIVQTDGTKVNTSTAGGNTVADGTKSTATTVDGTTVTSANGNTKYAADGVHINTTGKTPVSLTDAGLDNGNNVIKNVASGHVNNDATDNTNAANIADVKKATTTVTANAGEAANATTGNVTLTSTTAADGHTIYDVKLNDKVTLGTGANAVTIDGTAGKSTIGSSVIDGVNNTFTTGGANAVKLDGTTGTIKTGTVTVTGGTTNDITGLSNTTVTATDFATKGRAATEEQLKAVGEQTWQITADKDATTSGAQTGTKKDAKVGKDDKVQLIAGENMTVNQNERDFTFTLNKDLVKMNSATFEATGGKTTVIKGDSIVQTDGTKTNTATASGNTVANGTKSTETTAAGQVIKDGAKTNTSTVDENTIVDGAKSNKTTVDSNVIDDGNGNVNTSNATSNTITDGTNTSAVTAGKATIGTSVIDGVNNTFTTGGANAVKLDGAAGTIKTGTVTVTGGTTNDITGLSNTTVTSADFATKGRAATEEQLKAVGEQTWQITADKDATTSGAQTGTKKDAKVGKDDKVQLIAGENLTVNQNERDFTYSLNKDLVKMNSATFEATGGKTTVIKGDSIVQTDGTKVNTSTAGGNIVADGTKSTETTAAGQVIKDGAKSNKSTVDNNVIDDGNGNVNTSNATSNTITDGTNTTATTSSSVTVKDNTGNSTVITKDNITTGVGANKVTLDGTAGKATIGSSIVDGVNNTFTTGGSNAVKLDGVTGTIKTGTVTVTGGTTNDITGLSNTTVTSADFATKGRAATEEQLKAVGEQTWQITADKDATTSGAQTGTKKNAKVGKDDKVQLIAGENMTVNQNERDFTFTLNKDLVKMNSATFLGTGTNKTVITGDSITQTAGTQTNTSTAGGNTVADGTKSTETTAAGQVIKDGTKTNTSTVDENTIVDGTKSNKSTVDGNTITDGTNTTATTSSSVTVKDNAGNSTVITKDNITTGIGANKVTLDGTAGKAIIGSSVVDGVNNTFTTGGANAVKLDGVAGTIKTGTVTVTGGTTNDITGLSNTTVNSADFATKGRAATEEQLKAVGEQTWQITADKDTATSGAQTGTKKDAKVGKDDKVQLIAGENMTVNQNERDFTFTLNKDLVKMNSATFLGTGSNTTVITGNSITQTAGTQTNTSTAAGNTIANGTKSTETTADGQVIKDGAKSNKSTVDSNVIDDGTGNKNTSNATSNTITDGTNTSTITAGKANIGNIAVDGVNNKITMGNGATPVTLDGANGHLDGLTNTTWVPGVTKATTGRAATEDQLQQVSDAVGAGWKVNTGTVAGSSGVSNGAASTKVSSGEEVKLQAGDNLVIDQNGKTVSYSLNKDLTKMNSATFEATGGKTTVIKGDSIVQTDGGKTNTSNAAGNTVVDGNKSTATTAAGTTITDGAKTNTSTADKNVIDDGAGNTNVSNATSNTLKNAAGDETKADAKGVTVKDAAGNNATFTKDGITITKTGKDTVSLTSNGLDNGKNKIVNVAAGVANTDAVNVGQLKEYAAKSTTELTANGGQPAGSTTGNIVLTKTTAADGHTIYDNKLNDKITLGTDPTKAVTVDGTTGTVTGLTNKTWTPGSIVSGRAATEDQLKSAVADSGWKVTVDSVDSGKSTVVGTSPEKIKAEETVTFKAGNNMMVTQTGKSISYAVNPELTDMKSATFKDAAGNTTVTNGNGITITPGSANPTNPHAGPVSLTKDGLNNGNNQIKGVAPGTDPTDAVNVAQLNASNANTSQAINQVAGEVQHVGAHAAAMAALKPIQYDPLEPTQIMAGVGNYRGETAAALGLAHYTNENTMFNVGVSVGGNHNMVNAGVTHKFGYSSEKKNIPDRYKAGPISSVYVMQDEVSSLKKENAEQKYVIADQAARLTTLEAENEQQRRELAETKKGLDDLKAAVDKLLASKG